MNKASVLQKHRHVLMPWPVQANHGSNSIWGPASIRFETECYSWSGSRLKLMSEFI